MDELRMGPAFLAVLRRDLVLAFRSPGQVLYPLTGFALIGVLFPIGLAVPVETLSRVAPAVVWVAALLTALLSLDQVFRADFEDGTLEQFALSPQPLALLVLAKVLAHWLVTVIPVLLVTPLLGVQMGLDARLIAVLEAALLLGTPVISAIGSVGVALTVGLPRGGVLLSLLVLPLYVPVIIFATGAVGAAAAEFPFRGHLMLLAAMSVAAITLTPAATAAALRVALD